MKVLQYIISILLCIFLGGLCNITWFVYKELPQLKEDYIHAKNEFNSATAEWKRSTKATTDLWNSEKTQTSLGLLLRTGDDLNRGAKKFNATMDSLNLLITNTDKSLNQVVLPNANSAIDKTASSVQETLAELNGPIKETETLLKASTILVEDFNKNTTFLANSWVTTSDTINKTVEQLGPSTIQTAKNIEYDTKRMGDVLDATYNKIVRVKNWMVRVLMELGGWGYRVFVKP